jgi:hypothetical protein
VIARTRSGSNRVKLLLALAGVIIAAAGCRTVPSDRGGTYPLPAEGPPFRPTTYVAKPQIAQDARYKDLLSGASYMIWVSDDVISIKLAQDAAESLGEIDDVVDSREGTRLVNANFLVFELHAKSAFSDPSVASDFTRDLKLFLADDTGRKVSPLQVYVSKASESRIGMIKEFSRTIIVLFPRYDIITGNPTIGPDAPALRVYAQGYDTTFMFEWTRAEEVERSLHDRAGDFGDTVQMGFGDFCVALKDIFTSLK